MTRATRIVSNRPAAALGTRITVFIRTTKRRAGLNSEPTTASGSSITAQWSGSPTQSAPYTPPTSALNSPSSTSDTSIVQEASVNGSRGSGLVLKVKARYSYYIASQSNFEVPVKGATVFVDVGGQRINGTVERVIGGYFSQAPSVPPVAVDRWGATDPSHAGGTHSGRRNHQRHRAERTAGSGLGDISAVQPA